MHSSRGFDALVALFGEGRSVAVGTWYFVEADRLAPPLPNKPGARSVVASRDSDAEAVVVYPRSASRQLGIEHLPHKGHDCSASHDSRSYAHECHINKDGFVDPDTPITLSLGELEDCRMCVEDTGSMLLEALESELEP
jgi:hypothetical protein